MSARAPGRGARVRRSHAERTAQTRAKLIRAVVESIGEVGLGRTTANEIARRAGVSWGAVQHHFGGKEGILVAVLEDSFAHFAEGLIAMDVEEKTLEERIDLFVDRAWSHFSSPRYRCTFEILLNESSAPSGGGLPWQGEMLAAWNRVWKRFFPTAGRTRRETVTLQLHTIATLSGLAGVRMLGDPAARLLDGPLGLLKEDLAARLA